MGNSKDEDQAPSEMAPQPPNAPADKAKSTTSAQSKKTPDTDSRTAYSGGSWRGKATAVTEVAHESVSIPVTPTKPRSSTVSSKKSHTLLSPTKATPSAASATKINVGSKPADDGNAQDDQHKEHMTGNTSEKLAKEDEAKTDGSNETKPEPDRPLPAAGWRGWWSKSGESEAPNSKGTMESSITSTQSQDNGVASLPPQAPAAMVNADDAESEAARQQPAKTDEAPSTGQRSSWFGLWKAGDETSEQPADGASHKSPSVEPALSSTEAAPEQPQTPTTTSNQQSGHGRNASGSWAFWSREKPSASEQKPVEEGELAVAKSKTQSEPEPVTVRPAHPRQQSLQMSKKRKAIDQGSSSRPQSISEGRPSTTSSDAINPASSGPTDDVKALQALERTLEKTSKVHPNNLLLPPFRDTYQLAHTPSYWQQLIRMFGRGNADEHRHLSIASHPFKVKKAVTIGVHGYFPSPIVQKVLGPPTGTSVRFANEAASALEAWAEERNEKIEIERIALEGEGVIAYRLDTLWKLLLNFVDQLRSADLVFFACHSQGCPVGIMLASKLIQFGCLSPNARIGICAMAGVNLGPFASYKSRFLDSSASELFDFSNPRSAVSQSYSEALETVLHHHVRIAYIGSIDDQLVSMESSTFSTLNHPYIYRAVFVNGRIHAPDFLTHLVGFALKLRNLGLSDHGLIRELSYPLAGSLYTGDGHSRIYEDPRVYRLAIDYALETTSLSKSMPVKQKDYEIPAAKPNPYFLPWAMRGLLEEEFVRTELKDETEELLSQFEKWRPQSAVLKDVRFRLEAVRSKL